MFNKNTQTGEQVSTIDTLFVLATNRVTHGTLVQSNIRAERLFIFNLRKAGQKVFRVVVVVFVVGKEFKNPA